MKIINGYEIIATQEEVDYALSVLGEVFTKEELENTISSFRNTKQKEQLIAHFKNLYSSVVDNKLKELDYDSLATVKLWEGDTTFGVEASNILSWYKACIAKNYEILNAVNAGTRSIPTDEEYLAELPIYQGAIV